ncbi:MAG: carboxypeptidase-like regulatory domain-containing protein [Candidatus Zixiibacteriota bacterium]
MKYNYVILLVSALVLLVACGKETNIVSGGDLSDTVELSGYINGFASPYDDLNGPYTTKTGFTATIDVFDDGQLIAQTQTDSNSYYSISVTPGIYTLQVSGAHCHSIRVDSLSLHNSQTRDFTFLFDYLSGNTIEAKFTFNPIDDSLTMAEEIEQLSALNTIAGGMFDLENITRNKYEIIQNSYWIGPSYKVVNYTITLRPDKYPWQVKDIYIPLLNENRDNFHSSLSLYTLPIDEIDSD